VDLKDICLKRRKDLELRGFTANTSLNGVERSINPIVTGQNTDTLHLFTILREMGNGPSKSAI